MMKRSGQTGLKVTVRITQPLKERLDMMRRETGLSYSLLIREALLGQLKDDFYNVGREDGYEEALKMFVEAPVAFREKAVEVARKLGIEDFEPALFQVPCAVCGKPMVFSHRDENWDHAVKPELLKAFRTWSHVTC